MHLTLPASGLVAALASLIFLLLLFVPICLLALLVFYPFVMYYSASSVAAPRLNCSCICYSFDLRGYVPGTVLRMPDSMELFYPRDEDSLITPSCCVGSYICRLVWWYVSLVIRIWRDFLLVTKELYRWLHGRYSVLHHFALLLVVRA